MRNAEKPPKCSTRTHRGREDDRRSSKALVNPNGAEITECEFEYGTSPSELNQIAPCIPFPEAGENFVQVSAPVKGLSESTKYYYRVVAVSEFGEAIATP